MADAVAVRDRSGRVFLDRRQAALAPDLRGAYFPWRLRCRNAAADGGHQCGRQPNGVCKGA
ncbi:protein of unknown function (plasmid) [Rhodovastum atsumiense]|nr:protein of unknown function [Rhodovastum atsumiense]